MSEGRGQAMRKGVVVTILVLVAVVAFLLGRLSVETAGPPPPEAPEADAWQQEAERAAGRPPAEARPVTPAR